MLRRIVFTTRALLIEHPVVFAIRAARVYRPHIDAYR
jgi:hypothetical protein